jgi:hypothetical protein
MFKRKYYSIFIIGLLLFLSGCSETPEKYSLSLYHDDGSVYDVYNDLDREEVTLPFLEEEGMQFVGWDDGEDIYIDSYIVQEDTILTAVFEDAMDFFEFEYDSYSGKLHLTGYTGMARRIKIPEMYDGYYLEVIDYRAFKDSEIISVEIPMTVTEIEYYAFEDAKYLEEVSWYGQPYGYTIVQAMASDEFEAEINEYGDTCVVASVDGKTTQYESGCPIVEATQSESIYVQGVEYYTFKVTYDLSMVPEKQSQYIRSNAFKGAESLKTFEIPAGLVAMGFNGSLFDGVASLKNVTVDEKNMYFEEVNGVIFNEDLDYLVYYPNGLTASSYTIPDTVKTIGPYAFFNNNRLKEIVITENVEQMIEGFVGLHALETYVVDENNAFFYTIDGVLFGDLGLDVLISYPGGKLDKTYTTPDDIEQIGPSAFAYNTHLSEIIIGDDLLEIQYSAFMGTTSIGVLEIPGSVRRIRGNIIQGSQVHTVIIRSDELLSIPIEEHSFLLEHFYESIETPYTYATIYISDDIYDDYMILNNLMRLEEYYHPLSEYEGE